MGTILINASSSSDSQSFECNHAGVAAFNAFFESSPANGIDLEDFDETKTKSRKYIKSLKKEYSKFNINNIIRKTSNININVVKIEALDILTQFINDDDNYDNYGNYGNDIEFMFIKLLSLSHFLQQEPHNQQLKFCHFVFHFIISIILRCDFLHEVESKLNFSINTYFEKKIKNKLIAKCNLISNLISNLYNKNYILLQNELMPFVRNIKNISLMIADFVEYKYFALIQKMSLLFIHCMSDWQDFSLFGKCDLERIIYPHNNRYNLANTMAMICNKYNINDHESIEFEMEKVNACAFMFIFSNFKYMYPKLYKERAANKLFQSLRANTSNTSDTYTKWIYNCDAIHGYGFFYARFPITAHICRNPQQFLDLVSHFCNESYVVMQELLRFLMPLHCMLFLTDDRNKLDFMFNEIFIKYKVLQHDKAAFFLILQLFHNLAFRSTHTPDHDDGGIINNNIFKIIYPKYINDDIIRAAKQYHLFAKSLSKSSMREYARIITSLPHFTAVELFHEFMDKLSLFT